MNVLHVEDERIHHLRFKSMLEEIYGEEVAVVWAQTVDEGLKALDDQKFDVVFLDYVLGDGCAADIMNACNAYASPTPFVVVSAFEDHDFNVAALTTGADDYLIKGKFDTVDLERSITYSLYRKKKMADVINMAFYDRLTGLPNRNHFLHNTDKSVELAKRMGSMVAVYYVDLNNFKMINDQLGHEAGDVVLKTAAQRLSEGIRKTDTAIRFGGDEFLVISPGIKKREEIEKVGHKLVDTVSGSVSYKGDELVLTCSIGAANLPFDAETLNEAIQIADKAMYKAKGQGGGFWMFASHSEAQDAIHHRLRAV